MANRMIWALLLVIAGGVLVYLSLQRWPGLMAPATVKPMVAEKEMPPISIDMIRSEVAVSAEICEEAGRRPAAGMRSAVDGAPAKEFTATDLQPLLNLAMHSQDTKTHLTCLMHEQIVVR